MPVAAAQCTHSGSNASEQLVSPDEPSRRGAVEPELQ